MLLYRVISRKIKRFASKLLPNRRKITRLLGSRIIVIREKSNSVYNSVYKINTTKEGLAKDSGFTLIEVLIVIAILGVIVTPFFVQYFFGEQIEELNNQFYRSLGIGETGQLIGNLICGVTIFYFLVIRPKNKLNLEINPKQQKGKKRK